MKCSICGRKIVFGKEWTKEKARDEHEPLCKTCHYKWYVEPAPENRELAKRIAGWMAGASVEEKGMLWAFYNARTRSFISSENNLVFICSNCQDKWVANATSIKEIESGNLFLATVYKESACKKCGNDTFIIYKLKDIKEMGKREEEVEKRFKEIINSERDLLKDMNDLKTIEKITNKK